MGYLGCLIVSVFLIAFTATARPQPPSAHRNPNETYQAARDRNLGNATPALEDQAVALAELSFASVPRVEDVQGLFKQVRDRRFLRTTASPDFLRRPSWLYPQDGCWVRAALGKQHIQGEKNIAPLKLFSFGSLRVATQFASEGYVTWWYHVAPVVADTSGVAFVIDPAIEPARALPVREWLLRQVSDVKKSRLALCHSDTYSPDDDCASPVVGTDTDAAHDQEPFLYMEWQNLEGLGMVPKKILGEEPPWAGLPLIRDQTVKSLF